MIEDSGVITLFTQSVSKNSIIIRSSCKNLHARNYIGAPPAPSNLTSTVLSRGENALSVNLTWSQDNSRYVVVYDVEVTATNINITNMTTSQYIVLPLQIGVVFSFRVRGADSINRLGEWSNSVLYPG